MIRIILVTLTCLLALCTNGSAQPRGRDRQRPGNPTREAFEDVRGRIGAALVAAGGPAAPTAATVGRIRVRNLSDSPRVGIASAVVPFPPGVVQAADLPNLSVDGADCSALTPFGLPWPDGSLRYARAVARVPMDARGDAWFDVLRAPPPATRWKFADSIVAALDRFRLQAVCDGRSSDLDPASAGNAVLEATPTRIVVRYRSRVTGTPLMVEWILELGNDCDVVPFSCRVINSDPRVAAVKFQLQRLQLHVVGAYPMIRHAARLAIRVADSTGIAAMTGPSSVTTPLGAYDVTLLSNDYLGDGQGIRVDGALLFLPGDPNRWPTIAAEAQLPLLAIADGWGDSGAWGPFGAIPAPPPWIVDADVVSDRGALAFLVQPATVWQGGNYGLNPDSGSTGYQPDFGAAQGCQLLTTANPALLYAIQDSVVRECYRPLHFFEADTTNVLASRHPRLVIWGGRPHYDPSVSVDQLGKTPRQWLDSHGWSGPDNQHWSFLWLCAYALATGDYATLEEVRHHAQLWLSAQNTAPPFPNNWPTTELEVPRAAGRTLLTASWYALITGDAQLLARMNDRINVTIAGQWAGRDAARTVRPCGTLPSDDRQVPDGFVVGTTMWSWQDPLAVTGMAAAHAVTGNAQALAIAQVVARNWTTYGYRGDPRTDGECVAYAAYLNGVPFADQRGQVIWAAGTDFRTWASPCVVLAKRWAHEAADSAWEARCDAILDGLQSRRVRPSDGGWDQFAVWAGSVR